MISKRQLGVIMPEARVSGRLDRWVAPLQREMAAHEIVGLNREAMFLATIAEETGELRAQQENLNYSPDRLRQIFPSLFSADPSLADALVAQGPEAIANYIYDDAHRPPGYKMGNTQPGDGWRYRGRGPMQLTGRGNYERFFKSLGLPANSNPDLVLAPDIGAKSACHFWKAAGCNEAADSGDFDRVTRLVNGGTINMAARRRYYASAMIALETPDPPEPAASVPPPPIVPPPGYVEGPTGNIIREDVKDSRIVKQADQGINLTKVAAGASAVAGPLAFFNGMPWQSILAIGGLLFLGVAGFLLWKLVLSKRARVDMHNKGIA